MELAVLDDSTVTLGSGTEALIVVLNVTFSKLGVLIETGCSELQLSVITLDNASAIAIATSGIMLPLRLGFGTSPDSSAEDVVGDCSGSTDAVSFISGIPPPIFPASIFRTRCVPIINGTFSPSKSVPSV